MIMSLRQTGAIAVHHLRRVALDGAPIWLIGMPLVIIYVLGVTMSGLFTAEFTPAKPFRVVVAAAEPGPETSGTVRLLVGELSQAPDFFVVEQASGKEAARQAVLGRTADAAVVVSAEGPAFTVIASPGSVVADVVAGTLRHMEREGVIASGASSSGSPPRSQSPAQGAAADEAGSPPGPVAADAIFDAPWEGVGAFQYFSAAIMIMFMTFAGHSAMTYTVKDRATGAYLRIRSIGVSRGTYLAAGVVSSALVGAAFSTLMALITRVLFHVHWGDPLAWSLLTVTGAVSVAALSFLVMAVLPDNPKTVESAGSTIYTILSFLGGSTVPLTIMPDWFTRLFAWLPNRRMLDGYLAVAQGVTTGSLVSELTGIIVTAAVLMAVATLVTRAWKREGA